MGVEFVSILCGVDTRYPQSLTVWRKIRLCKPNLMGPSDFTMKRTLQETHNHIVLTPYCNETAHRNEAPYYDEMAHRNETPYWVWSHQDFVYLSVFGSVFGHPGARTSRFRFLGCWRRQPLFVRSAHMENSLWVREQGMQEESDVPLEGNPAVGFL